MRKRIDFKGQLVLPFADELPAVAESPTFNNPPDGHARPWDEVGFIIAWEDGQCDEETTVEGFQHLIDNGHAWTLQGTYGRTAMALIEAGLCRK